MNIKTIDKIGSFVRSLCLPVDVAIVLLESEEDCQDFFENYYKRNKYVIDDLLDYRENKVEKSGITLDKFIKMCKNGNIRQAFEKTFFQSFDIRQITMVEDALDEGRASLEGIYRQFQKNPNKNILQIVL